MLQLLTYKNCTQDFDEAPPRSQTSEGLCSRLSADVLNETSRVRPSTHS